jgi:hypothetical protein
MIDQVALCNIIIHIDSTKKKSTSCRTLRLLKLRLERNMPYLKLGITGTVATVNAACFSHENCIFFWVTLRNCQNVDYRPLNGGIVDGLGKYRCLKDYGFLFNSGL